MYLRFIGTQIDEDSKTEKGIFSLAYELQNSALLNKGESGNLIELLDWFKDNLPIPDKFKNDIPYDSVDFVFLIIESYNGSCCNFNFNS